MLVRFPPKQNGFTVLLRGGKFDELNGFVKVLFHNFFDFFKRYIKELPPLVDKVELAVRKCIVQSSFQLRRIVREDHCVNIEIERNGSVPQLVHSILRVKPPCHSDFVYILSECSDV